MTTQPLAKLKSLKRAVVRLFRLDLGRALVTGLPRALRQDFRLAMRHLWQDHQNRRAAPKEVLLSQLRTASHILDKGLSCGTWERGRGRTAHDWVRALLCAIGDEARIVSDPSYQWAVERVREYEAAQETGRREDALRTPPTFSEADRQAFMNFIHARRSTRHFRPEKIARELLETIAAAVCWAPCSCCRQPVVLHITQQEGLVKTCLEQCSGATGFSGAVPCFVSVCADTRFYSLIDRHLPLIDASLGTQSFLLAAYANGLSGTALNWMHATSRQERTLRRVLSIPSHERVVFNVAMGYPETLPREPGYKSLEATCVFIGD